MIQYEVKKSNNWKCKQNKLIYCGRRAHTDKE